MQSWPCPIPACKKVCRSPGGLTQHLNHKHRHHKNFGKCEATIHRTCHPILDGRWNLLPLCAHINSMVTGTPCDADGYDLEPGGPPQDHSDGSQPNWSPFSSQTQFETADFLFRKAEMSQADIDILMRLWATTTSNGCAPFQNHQEMLATIDAIDLGDIPWQTFSAKYRGEVPPENPPDWMLKEYTVFFRDPLSVVRSMISNPEFNGQFDYAPYREFEGGKRRWSDLMSGNWVWKQAVCLISKFRPQSRTHNTLRISLARTLVPMGQWWFRCSSAAIKR